MTPPPRPRGRGCQPDRDRAAQVKSRGCDRWQRPRRLVLRCRGGRRRARPVEPSRVVAERNDLPSQDTPTPPSARYARDTGVLAACATNDAARHPPVHPDRSAPDLGGGGGRRRQPGDQGARPSRRRRPSEPRRRPRIRRAHHEARPPRSARTRETPGHSSSAAYVGASTSPRAAHVAGDASAPARMRARHRPSPTRPLGTTPSAPTGSRMLPGRPQRKCR
jgi:hypothetical protein